jgi:hypothetical protein
MYTVGEGLCSICETGGELVSDAGELSCGYGKLYHALNKARIIDGWKHLDLGKARPDAKAI